MKLLNTLENTCCKETNIEDFRISFLSEDFLISLLGLVRNINKLECW